MTGVEARPESPGCGRFAPSPTGDLHLGNLRTALLAWSLARQSGRGFLMRMEDLDARSRPEFVSRQLADLEAVGVEWDGPVLFQSARLQHYRDVVDDLSSRGMLYECYCTRRDLAEAPSAPHSPPGAYPGTCRGLSERERSERRAALTNRGPALRLAARAGSVAVVDAVFGPYTGTADDLVILRGDGVFSYNFASVLDDAATGVTQVVRGDDLLPSTPRQAHLHELLGFTLPEYAHVPLVENAEGARLAKRDGAVTMEALKGFGWTPADVVELLGASLGMGHPRTAAEFADLLRVPDLRRPAWRIDPAILESGPTPETFERLTAAKPVQTDKPVQTAKPSLTDKPSQTAKPLQAPE